MLYFGGAEFDGQLNAQVQGTGWMVRLSSKEESADNVTVNSQVATVVGFDLFLFSVG